MTDSEMQQCILAAYECGVGALPPGRVAGDDLTPSLAWDFPFWAMYLGAEHVGYCRTPAEGHATLATLADEVRRMRGETLRPAA